MKKIIFTLIPFLSILITHAGAQELLTNGGFESWTAGKPNGWNVTNTINIVQNSLIFSQGTSSAKIINSTTSSFNMTQSVAVSPGNTYTVTLSYYIQQGDGTDARINCYFRDASNKAIKWSLEDSLALKGPGGNGSYFPNILNTWKTYTYDVVAPSNASTFLLQVTTGSYGTVCWDNFSFKQNSTPTIYSSTSSLSGFIYAPGKGPSSEQSFKVRANNVTGSLIINAPADYEISVGSGSSFVGTNSISIPASNGSVSYTTIYTRLKAGLGINTYNETLTMTANGATSQNISLNGSVSTSAPITTVSSTSLSGFNYVESQGPSSQKSFTVGGSNLTGSIIVNAPTGYELSVLSGTSFVGTSSLTLAQSNGNVASTLIFVRLAAGLSQGNYNGNIAVTTSGTSTKTLALTGVVNPMPGLFVSTNSLTGISYGLGAGPSNIKSFNVSGTGLSSYMIVSAPSYFEISADSASSFIASSQLVLPQSGVSTPVYVRLKAGLAIGTYTEDILVSSTNMTSQNVTIVGNVWPTTNTNEIQEAVKITREGDALLINGLEDNTTVDIYSTMGILLRTAKVQNNTATFQLPTQNTYLVKYGNRVKKVIL